MLETFKNIDFYDKWIKYQTIIKRVLFAVLLILILIITYLTTMNGNPYLKTEKDLINKAKNYIRDNNIDIKENFYLDILTLSDNGYYVKYANNINCDIASGVYITINNNKYTYNPYLICDDYQSETIKNIVNKKSSLIELQGANPLIINEEELFVDPGYINKSSYQVTVDNEVSDAPGLYIVNYTLKDNEQVKETVKRIVILTKNSEDDINGTAFHNGQKLKLIGAPEIEVEHNQKYEELGAMATDYKAGDISDKIQIYGSVDTSKVAKYTITYTLISSGTKLSVKRIINVVKPKTEMVVNYTLNNDSITNDNVIITMDVDSTDYRYTILPNLAISYSRKIDYKVSNNGSYVFKIYDSYGGYEEKIIKVNNIDKSAPFATCSLNDKTVTVNASDINGIVGYSYLDGSVYTSYLSTNQYNLVTAVNTTSVKVKDKAGNIKLATCSSQTVNNPSTPSNNVVEYHFLDLGRVDGILIRYGDHAAFVDGGYPHYGKKVVAYLKALGIKKLDFIIGSHSHLNHVGALGDVVDNFEVGAVYFVENPLNCKYCDQGAYDSVNKAMKSKGLTATIQKKGDIVYLGDMSFECIAPIYYRSGGSSAANFNSLNHIVTYGQIKMLLTGDYLYKEGVIKEYSKEFLDIDILKYPHHGNYNISKQMLDILSPSYVILQNNRDELGRSAATSKTLLQKANLKMYQNYLDGNIVVITDGNNITIKTKVNPSTFKNE